MQPGGRKATAGRQADANLQSLREAAAGCRECPLGEPATQTVWVSVLKERGQWLEREDGIPVLLTLHPSALLRGDREQLESAFEAWLQDLRKAGRHT